MKDVGESGGFLDTRESSGKQSALQRAVIDFHRFAGLEESDVTSWKEIIPSLLGATETKIAILALGVIGSSIVAYGNLNLYGLIGLVSVSAMICFLVWTCLNQNRHIE